MPTRVMWRREERSHINAQINCTEKAERERGTREGRVQIQSALKTQLRQEEKKSEIRSTRGGKGGENGPWLASEMQPLRDGGMRGRVRSDTARLEKGGAGGQGGEQPLQSSECVCSCVVVLFLRGLRGKKGARRCTEFKLENLVWSKKTKNKITNQKLGEDNVRLKFGRLRTHMECVMLLTHFSRTHAHTHLSLVIIQQ